jgi:hypothetical protein
MSMNPPPAEPESGVPQPARRGMGTGAKVLLTLGVVFGGLLLVCCGVTGFFVYRVSSSYTKDPAAIRQISAKIATVDLPPQFAPAGAVDNFSIPFTGISFSVAIYAEKPDGSTIMLASVQGKDIASVPQQQLEMQLKQATANQSGGAKPMVIDETHQRKLTVRGKPVSFAFSTGKEGQSGKPWLQASGMFPSDSGITMFMFSGDSAKYNEDQVAKIIESIH